MTEGEAEAIAEQWYRSRGHGHEDADQQEAEMHAVHRALVALLPDQEYEAWTVLDPARNHVPTALVLGESALWAIDGAPDHSLNVIQHRINTETMRLSVVERSSATRAMEGPPLITVERTWRLSRSKRDVAFIPTTHRNGRPATDDAARSDELVRAIARRLGWDVPETASA